jgi:acetylornithine deacetylase
VGLSTYAPTCELKVERRTLPGETMEMVQGELESIVRTVDPDAEVECFFDRPPLACDRGAAIVSTVRAAVHSVTGEPPEEAGVGFWMDAAVFAAAGIPTVNYGPAGAGAHETVEWVDLASVVQCARVLHRAGQDFFRSRGRD